MLLEQAVRFEANPPDDHPALIAPKQRRSRELAERVLAATKRLLRRTNFRDLAMSDVAREAGVSVGAIYTRFPSKERLLCFLADRVLVSGPDGAAAAILQPHNDAPDLRAFLTGYLTSVAEFFTRYRAIVAPMSTMARESQDGELKVFLTKVNAAAHERLKQAMLRHAKEIRHRSPDAAIDFVILWIGAAMRERVLFGEPVSRPSSGVSAFIVELAEAATLYLTARRAAP